MSMMNLSSVSRALNASFRGEDAEFQFVSTDTRTINPGELFIALVGPQFDGHDFIEAAMERGAVAAMVSKPVKTTLPVIEVADTGIALGQLATFHRQQFSLALAAVTGSNGKTTTKEMLASILGQRGSVLASKGNLNNDIGVPLTLLRLTDEHQFAVIEMGANHSGEIAYTVQIAKPYVALITNAASAHLEGFGSLEGVARAKGEIYQGLPIEGIAVINADDNYAAFWQASLAGRKFLTFGIKNPADYSASALTMDDEKKCSFMLHSPTDQIAIKLPLSGYHNVSNALAAAAAAQALGISLAEIKAGLEAMQPVKGRLVSYRGLRESHIIDDSYNANPNSVRAALEVLAQYPGTRVFVMGDMAELGDAAKHYHEWVGQQAKQLGIDYFYACGGLTPYAVAAFGKGGQHFKVKEELISVLRNEIQSEMTVLIKGSRSAGMEHVVYSLTRSS